MIAALFAVALASAIPLGLLGVLESIGRTSTAVAALTVGSAIGVIAALALEPGLPAAILVGPWWLLTLAIALGAALAALRELATHRTSADPQRLGIALAAAFLATGATWAVLERAGVRPFGFDRTIVLLTAVHFHVAGFVLTLAGVRAWLARPRRGVLVAVGSVGAGTPLTALGFFGYPAASWIGALLVAGGGIGIGSATIAAARGVGPRAAPLAKGLLTVGGGTLFVTMPLAAAYATGATFGIGFLDIPAMAALHGGLNVVGFAIPTMAGWSFVARRERSAR